MAQQALLDRPRVLEPGQWLPRARAHGERAAHFTEPYLQRRSAGRKHPVEDFLFTYYTPEARPAAALAPGSRRRPLRRRGRASGPAGSITARPTPRELAGSRDCRRQRRGHVRRRTAFLAARRDALAFARDHPGRDRRAAGAVRLLRAARVGHGLPRRTIRAPARVPGAAARRRGHRPGGGGQPDPLLALRRLPLLHAGRRSAEHAGPSARTSGAGAARLPARQHGPVQVGLQAVPRAAQRAGDGLLRAVLADPGHGHAGLPVRPVADGATSRCGSRPPKAGRSMWPPSGPLPPKHRCCAAGCWRRWTCWTTSAARVWGNASTASGRGFRAAPWRRGGREFREAPLMGPATLGT